MKFGYVLENFGENLNPQNLVKSAQFAEEIGFHSIWATDHILRPSQNNYPLFNNLSESITTIAYLAGKTNSVELGISTLVLPQRNPIVVAKQLATLSYLTEGRLSITFGAGQDRKEFGYLQQSFNNRGKRFNEQIELIQQLWRGGSDFRGNYYSFEDVIFSPTNSYPNNIFIAGNSEFALERAIKYNLGWHPTSISPDKVVETLDNNQLKIDDIQIMFRLTVKDLKSLHTVIEGYKEIGIKSMILRFPGGVEELFTSKDVLATYL